MRFFSLLFLLVSFQLSAQTKIESEKYIKTQIKQIKRNYLNTNSKEFKDALDNIFIYLSPSKNTENHIVFQSNAIAEEKLNDYCKAVNFILKKIKDRTPLISLNELKSVASSEFYNLDEFLFSKVEKDSINEMSSLWKNTQLLIEKNKSWVDEYFFNKINLKKNNVFQYYFGKLKDSKNLNDQNNIVNECLTMFPEINGKSQSKTGILNLIIGGYSFDSSWPNGKIQLYDYSYLLEYFNFQPSQDGDNPFGYKEPPMGKLKYWLKKNDKNQNLLDTVIYETLCFKKGQFIDTLRSYQDNNNFIEIIFLKENKQKYTQVEYLKCIQINYLENLSLVKSRFFEYNPGKNDDLNYYEFHFRGGKNLELDSLDKKLMIIKSLIESKEYDEAINLINSSKRNFPEELEQNKKLKNLYEEANELKNSFNRVLEQLKETDKLILNKKYEDALVILNDIKTVISQKFSIKIEQYNITEQKIENLKGLMVDEQNEQLEVTKKIDNGKKLLNSNNLDLALQTFQSARNNNLPNDRNINIELEKLIKEVKEKQKIEAENKQILKLDQAISDGNKLSSLKKYDEALKLFQNARRNNLSSNLSQNRTLDEKINATQDLLKQELKRKLYENFEKDLAFTKIGKVEISKEYLKTDCFTNGDKLEFAETADEFVEKTLDQLPVYCYYNFDSEFANKGYYYNIFAINDFNGRKLYDENYRLPFSSELDYIKRKIDNQEEKKDYKSRKELKDYIFKSNSDLNFNGYNFVNYERKTFNGMVTSEKILSDKLNCGFGGYIVEQDELQHSFWIYNDLDHRQSEIEYYDKFLNTNFGNSDYSEINNKRIEYPIEYGIYGIKRKENYSSDPVYFLVSSQNIEDVLPRNGHKGEYLLFASQIKLVKQRKSIVKNDWLSNSNSTKPVQNYDYYDYKNSKNKIISEIKIARNKDEWFNLINNEIPACASFEFNLSNDLEYGKVYNKYVFHHNYKMNSPFVPNSKSLELIDLSNLRYSFWGSGSDFFDLLYNEHDLKTGGSTIEKNNSLIWKNNNSTYIDKIDRTSYIAVTKYSSYCKCDRVFLGFFYKSENYDTGIEEITLELVSFDYQKNSNFPGYSIRFLKN